MLTSSRISLPPAVVRFAVGAQAAVLLLACAVALPAETHRFEPTQFHNTFSFAHPPVLHIKPGDRVITHTIDARGFDAENNKVGERPNPQTGPFYIEGADPGDVLVIRFEKIEPSRATAWSSSLLAPYAADPDFLRFEGEREQTTETWNIDKQERRRPSPLMPRFGPRTSPFRCGRCWAASPWLLPIRKPSPPARPTASAATWTTTA